MRSNIWEIEQAQKALRERPPAVALANRYLEKALECMRCMYCHGSLSNPGLPYRPHFKGYVHLECAEKYDGRLDFERQHAIRNEADGEEFSRRFPYADKRERVDVTDVMAQPPTIRPPRRITVKD